MLAQRLSPTTRRLFSARRFLHLDTQANEVILDIDSQGVAHVALNRPKANCLSRSLVTQLRSTLSRITSDSSIRAVILSGGSHGGPFCAGADLKERATMTSDAEVKEFVAWLRDTMSMVEQLPMPSIAAAEGSAFGGGLELMLACDIRIMSKTAVLGLTETSLGIIPGAGGTQRLPRLIGLSRAKELIFTAARLNSDRALAIGLVNHTVESGTVLKSAMDLCHTIAKQAPLANRLAKTAMNEGFLLPMDRALSVERFCYNETVGTADRVEGLKAFKEKRAPIYVGK